MRAAGERKRGFTDEEAVQRMIVLEESHAGSMPDEQLADERAWIEANGRRILTNAYVGHEQLGRGVTLIHWTPDPSERLSSRKFTYMRESEHRKYLRSPTSPAMQEIGELMRAEWERRVSDYHLERNLIVVILSVDPRARRSGVSYYLLAPAGGGDLEDRVMELMPEE